MSAPSQAALVRLAAPDERDLGEGLLWPEPSIGLNPSFAKGAWIDELVGDGLLHTECGRIFRVKRDLLHG